MRMMSPENNMHGDRLWKSLCHRWKMLILPWEMWGIYGIFEIWKLLRGIVAKGVQRTGFDD